MNDFEFSRNLYRVKPEPLNQFYSALLVVRAQTGDETAFTELVAQFAPRLRYFLSFLIRDRDAVDDELQNVWLDVHRCLPQLTNPSAFTAWIYRIARMRAARRHRRKELVIEACPMTDVPDDGDDFSAAEASAIHAALKELSTEHREVLALRFLEEMSYSDIADVTGLPVGTVRSRLHFAKKALRIILETEMQNDGEQLGS